MIRVQSAFCGISCASLAHFLQHNARAPIALVGVHSSHTQMRAYTQTQASVLLPLPDAQIPHTHMRGIPPYPRTLTHTHTHTHTAVLGDSSPWLRPVPRGWSMNMSAKFLLECVCVCVSPYGGGGNGGGRMFVCRRAYVRMYACVCVCVRGYVGVRDQVCNACMCACASMDVSVVCACACARAHVRQIWVCVYLQLMPYK